MPRLRPRERSASQMAAHGCRNVSDPKTVRRPAINAPAFSGLAGERRRSGAPRVGILLAREGVAMNHKKLFRLLHRSPAQAAQGSF